MALPHGQVLGAVTHSKYPEHFRRKVPHGVYLESLAAEQDFLTMAMIPVACIVVELRERVGLNTL